MTGGEIKLVLLAGLPLAAMLLYIYWPEPDHWPIYNKYPPELFQNGFEMTDPFKDPTVLRERLEDLGQFSNRYGSADWLHPHSGKLYRRGR